MRCMTQWNPPFSGKKPSKKLEAGMEDKDD